MATEEIKYIEPDDVPTERLRERIERLETLLSLTAPYVPRYDEDGHPLPLKQTIEAELGLTRGTGG